MRANEHVGRDYEACKEGIGETEWADYALGSLAPGMRSRLERHLAGCRACAAQHREWSRLLADGGKPARKDAGQAADRGGEAAGEGGGAADHGVQGANGGRFAAGRGKLAVNEYMQERDVAIYAAQGREVVKQAADEKEQTMGAATEAGDVRSETVFPSERVYRSLRREVRRRRAARMLRRWSLGGGVAAAAVAFGLTLLIANRPDQPLDAGPVPRFPIDAYMMSEEPDALRVLQASDTSEYRIESLGATPGNGYIWLSGDSSEAFLLLDGLPDIVGSDYQAWALTGESQSSLGLVKLAGTRGYLHIRTGLLGRADLLSLSAEPKGGSSYPTTEPIVLLLFQRPR